MRFKSTLAVIITILTIFFWPCSGRALTQSSQKPYQAGELLVKYKTAGSTIKRSALHASGLVRSARTIGRSQIQRVVLEPGTTVEQAISIYRNDPDVEIVEPNYILSAQKRPNDTDFSRQWGLHNTGENNNSAGIDIDALQAWNIITNSAEVVVAVVDTGCNIGHPDLMTNIWRNPGEIEGDGKDNDGNGYIDDIYGWDFADKDNDPSDASGHGTHIAGIIAAEGNNHRGVSGMTWKARIMPVRFMSAFDIGTTADAIDAIEYAVNNGAQIINCSWGGANYSRALRSAMASTNILFVCAAGNSSKDTDAAPYYPASYNNANIISVAASNQADELAWFSNYGTVNTDVAAPGTLIYGLTTSRQDLWSKNFYDSHTDGWSFGGLNDHWQITEVPNVFGTTALYSGFFEKNIGEANAWARLPAQSLGKASAALITFNVLTTSKQNSSRLYLEISTNGNTWINLPVSIGGTIEKNGITGHFPYWTTALADLGRWDGSPAIHLRLRFYSPMPSSETGFFIDNMYLTVADTNDSYQFMQGTSMAAAYVSGLAALIRSENTSLKTLDVKFIIENSVDLKDHFLQTVGSGGRINAHNALTLLRELSLKADLDTLDSINLSWKSDIPLDGPIVIQRRSNSEMDFSNVAQVDPNAETYIDDNILSETTYFYRIQAQTKEGEHRYSHQTLAGGTDYSSVGASGGHGGSSGGGCFINILAGP